MTLKMAHELEKRPFIFQGHFAEFSMSPCNLFKVCYKKVIIFNVIFPSFSRSFYHFFKVIFSSPEPRAHR